MTKKEQFANMEEQVLQALEDLRSPTPIPCIKGDHAELARRYFRLSAEVDAKEKELEALKEQIKTLVYAQDMIEFEHGTSKTVHKAVLFREGYQWNALSCSETQSNRLDYKGYCESLFGSDTVAILTQKGFAKTVKAFKVEKVSAESNTSKWKSLVTFIGSNLLRKK